MDRAVSGKAREILESISQLNDVDTSLTSDPRFIRALDALIAGDSYEVALTLLIKLGACRLIYKNYSAESSEIKDIVVQWLMAPFKARELVDQAVALLIKHPSDFVSANTIEALQQAASELPEKVQFSISSRMQLSPEFAGRSGGAVQKNKHPLRARIVREIAQFIRVNEAQRGAIIFGLVQLVGIECSRQYVNSVLNDPKSAKNR